MDPLEEQLKQLKIINIRHMPTAGEVCNEKVAAITKILEEKSNAGINNAGHFYNPGVSPKRMGPLVPPKPLKKNSYPEVPQSSIVKHVCEPLYSQRLQCSDGGGMVSPSILLRRQQSYSSGGANSMYERPNKVTLDNPAVLEQQLEALAHHKKQLERKGLLPQDKQHNSASLCYIPKLSSTSLIDNEDVPKNYHNVIYSNLRTSSENARQGATTKNANLSNDLYTNMPFEGNNYFGLPEKRDGALPISALSMGSSRKAIDNNEDEITAPPSPVSSSYSELRRATDVFTGKEKSIAQQIESVSHDVGYAGRDDLAPANLEQPSIRQTYSNISNQFNNYSLLQPSINNDCSDYYGFGGFSQGSSTYESIYEPINPRPPSQQSARSNFLMYSPYANSAKLSDGTLNNVSTSASLSSIGNLNGSSSLYPSNDVSSSDTFHSQREEVDVLTDYLVNSLDTNDADNYGICYKCNERVLGENNGCTAMDQIYHISCFTCSQCQINLQGKPFYAIEGKPYCEYDYLQTLEKCSVCMKPILERILRATGKPYHPQCFTCVVCGNSLDGVPFTVDATNQNYCIADFHKKFAPRCCVCKEPIMPDPGEEETVRVVALDRSFHFECYKCEDCGLLLSSEAEGRGCYPLDGHVLCKCCNAKRVQMLTNKMTTQL